IAAAEVVREVADDRLLTGAFLDLFAQILTDVRLPTMPERVGFPGLAQVVALPFRALRQDHQRIIAGSFLFVGENQIDEFLQVELVFRNGATGGSDIRSVEGGITGIAAEYPENPDAFVRSDRGPLPPDRRGRGRDGARKPNALRGGPNLV